MFAPRYFAPRYFASRYWADAGSAAGTPLAEAGYFAPRYFCQTYFAGRYWCPPRTVVITPAAAPVSGVLADAGTLDVFPFDREEEEIMILMAGLAETL